MNNERQRLDPDKLSASLLDIAVESWRFSRTFGRLVGKLDAGDQGRFHGQIRWFSRKLEGSLEAVGMHVVNVEGQPFDPGMAASPLNIDEFGPEDSLIVDQMLEPIIMGPDGVVRTGTVTLRRIRE